MTESADAGEQRRAEQLEEMRRIRPRPDLVLVRQDRKFRDDPDARIGSIYTAQIAIELPDSLTGEVVTVGKGARVDSKKFHGYVPHDVTPGMRVRWPREWGTELARNSSQEDQYLFVRADKLVAEEVPEENAAQ